MAGYKIIKISENDKDDAYLNALGSVLNESSPDTVIFIRDVWFGPVWDPDSFVSDIGAYGADVLYADPEAPSDLFIVRNDHTKYERVAELLEKGIGSSPDAECLIRLALPLEGIRDPFHTVPLVLLENRVFPFVRKDLFCRNYKDVLKDGIDGTANDVIEYLRNETQYDTGIILKELISGKNMADLKKNLSFDKVLSTTQSGGRLNTIKKIALRLHLYYEDEAAFCRKYIENMPEGTDVFITVPDEKKKASAEKAFEGLPYKTEFRVVGNRGRDISAFLTGIKDVVYNYDLICVVHDKKVVQVVPMTIGASWAYQCFENLLASKVFVENVISEFEKDEFLGMLQPPLPVHSVYYTSLGKGEWSGNDKLVMETAARLGINVDIDPQKEPVAPIGDMFWVRPKALKPLFDHDWKYEDYPAEPLPVDRTLLHALERLFQFAVQASGYYNAWLLSDDFAGIAIDNLEYMNNENIREIMKKTGPGSIHEMLDRLREISSHKGEDHMFDDLIEEGGAE